MTQTPHRPPHDPPEPLDEAERELARALRSLPAGSPPPELDARILGAARRAVQLSQPRRKLSWIRSLSIGTAASALLAMGLFLTLHGPSEHQFFTPTAEPANDALAPAAASAPVAAPAAAKAEGEPAERFAAPKAFAPSPPTREAIARPPPAITQDVTPMSTSAPMPAMASPPPPPPVEESPPSMDRGMTAGKQEPSAFPATVVPAQKPPVAAQNAPSPPPTETASPVLRLERIPIQSAPAPAADEQAREAGAMAGRDVRTESEAAAPVAADTDELADKAALAKDSERKQDALKSAPAVGGAAQPTGSAGSITDESADKKAKRPESVTVTGANLHRSEIDTRFPSVGDDAALTPEEWIERIRARKKALDGIDARESLKRFHARYPYVDIPEDLQPLLQ